MPDWDATHRLGGLDFSDLSYETLERAWEQLTEGPPRPPLSSHYQELLQKHVQERKLDQHLTEIMAVRGIQRGFGVMEVLEPPETRNSFHHYRHWLLSDYDRFTERPVIVVLEDNSIGVLYPEQVRQVVELCNERMSTKQED